MSVEKQVATDIIGANNEDYDFKFDKTIGRRKKNSLEIPLNPRYFSNHHKRQADRQPFTGTDSKKTLIYL